MLEQTPLPANPYDLASQPHLHRDFASCARVGGATSWESFFDELHRSMSQDLIFNTSPQIAGKTLGYALIYAPTIVGRDRLAHELITFDNDPEVFAGLANLYIFGLIRICSFHSSTSYTTGQFGDQLTPPRPCRPVSALER